ncbi:MAG: chromate efflux transporter [Rhodospirillaceae bacterium]
MQGDIPTFREAFAVWLRIGLLSFGGPAGQIALMHRILVDERRWISEGRFLHALNYCMLLPGPEAQQLATYCGWLMHRTVGGLAAGILFVLPGAVVMLALSVLYAGFRDVTFVEALFFGVKAAVLAVVIQAVIRIGSRALRNRAMIAIAASAFVAIYFLAIPFPLIVLGAATIGLAGGRLCPHIFSAGGHGDGSAADDADFAVERMKARGLLGHTSPSARRAVSVSAICLVLWILPVALLAYLLGPGHVYVQEGLFFSKMAVVTFGGAYAVLAYVAQQAVEVYGWLAPGEMLDGLGMAETTPGPLILVVQHVGFIGAFRNPGALDPMLAGTLGAILTTWVTFVPCFLWIFLGAPWIERLRGNRVLNAALTAITAAVVGVILNLAVWFGTHALFAEVAERTAYGFRLYVPAWETLDPGMLLLTVGALVATLRFGAGMLPTLAVSALLGVVWFYGGR